MSKSDMPGRDATPVDPSDRGRLFTITLRDSPDGALRGRLTHVASGDAAHFDSGAELVSALQRVGRSR